MLLRDVSATADSLIAARVAFDGSFGVKVCSDGRFKLLVIFVVLQRADHCFGREPMADGIAAGMVFALFRNRTVLLRALRRVASICLNEVIVR